MSGHMIYRPHVHTNPPLFSAWANPRGSIWACDCGLEWTLVNVEGVKVWRSGRGPWPPKYTDDLDGALRFIRDEANRHRRELGLPEFASAGKVIR